jgi:hypothetical protein
MIQDEHHDFYAQTLYKFSYGIIPMAIGGIGYIGNFFVILVYLRKKFAKNSLKLYFISLAISDSLSLISSLKIFIAYYLELEIELLSEASCKISEYVDFILPSVSAWTLVAISFDRMIKIVCAKRMQLMNKPSFQVITLLLIFIFNMLIYIPSLLFRRLVDEKINPTGVHLEWHRIAYMNIFDYHMINFSNESLTMNASTKRTCQFKLNVLTSNWVHMINSSLLPFLLMIMFSSLTIIHILKSRRKLKSSKCFSRAATVHPQPFTISQATTAAQTRNQISIKYKSSFSRDKIFVLNSISLNFIFLFLTLPILVLNVISTQYRSTQFNPYLVSASINLFFFNYASLFFINIISNSIFRSEFALMMRFRKIRASVSNTNRSSVEQINIVY